MYIKKKKNIRTIKNNLRWKSKQKKRVVRYKTKKKKIIKLDNNKIKKDKKELWCKICTLYEKQHEKKKIIKTE